MTIDYNSEHHCAASGTHKRGKLCQCACVECKAWRAEDPHDLLVRFEPGTLVRAKLDIIDAATDSEVSEGREGTVQHQEGALVSVQWHTAPPFVMKTPCTNLEAPYRLGTAAPTKVTTGWVTAAPTKVTMTHDRFARMTDLPRYLVAAARRLVAAFDGATFANMPTQVEELSAAKEALRAALRTFDASAPTEPPPGEAPPWRKDWPEGWPDCVTAGCREPPSFAFVWPGRGRLHACFTCATRMLHVAEAVGLDAKSLQLVYMLKGEPK